MNPPRPSSLPPQQEEELEALRSIYGSDWVDLPPPKTAWGTKKGEEGWWIVRLKGDDERVSVKLKGRFTKVSLYVNGIQGGQGGDGAKGPKKMRRV